jgi:hypothetical protein
MKTCDVGLYVLQEWTDNVIINTLKNNLSTLNSNSFQIIQGKWGYASLNHQIESIESLDFLVLADCFYSKQSFPFILSTIRQVMIYFNLRVICVYHLRKYNYYLLYLIFVIFVV